MIERFHRELLNFLVRQVGCRSTAADLTQESYARVLAAQQSGAAVVDVRALLFRTARNLVVDQHRRSEVRRHDDLDALTESEQPVTLESQQPEQILSQRQQADALLAAIDALPPRCREAFMMSRFDGLSHQQIAEHMGISKNMVAQHVTRGLLACHASLQAPPTDVSQDGP